MMINQERLFKLLPLFFEKASSAIMEIAQNAQRARATKLDIMTQGNCLVAVDNGIGTNNVNVILTLADSDWDPDVEENQTPAGWGLFFIICISEFVRFSSKFGTLAIESDKFLNDAEYRNGIIRSIDAKNKINGFKISAILKPNIDMNRLIEEEMLAFFPLDITINGKPIQRKAIEIAIDDNDYIETEYHGNRVLIRKYPSYVRTFEPIFYRVLTIWYGIPISPTRCTDCHNVAIDVTEGSPLTPVLPYRNSIKQDEKLNDFLQFVRDEYVKWGLTFINDNVGYRPVQDIVSVMKNLSHIATQEEMDRLDYFFVEEEDPYCHNSYSSSQDKIIKKGDIVRSESISLTINKEQYEDDDEIVIIPEGMLTKRTTCHKYPSWLKIQDEVIPVAITYDLSAGYSGNYAWHKAIIQSSKPIYAVASIDFISDGRIFYANSPRDFYKVQDAVFEKRIYNEDGDTWDSQQYDFEKEIEEDIRAIIGEYRKSDLLFDISKACGIKSADIVAIQINETTITVKTKKASKKIKIAA